MKKNLKEITVCTTLAAAFALTAWAAPATAATLFRAATVSPPAPQAERIAALRERFVELDIDLAALPVGEVPKTLDFNLFADTVLPGQVVEDRQTRRGTRTLTGTLVGDEDGRFALAVAGDVLSANVRTGDGRFYHVRHAGPGIQVVREVAAEGFPGCGLNERSLAVPQGASALVADVPAPSPIDGSRATTTLDVLVVYTSDARLGEGGTAAIESLVDLAIVESNQAYTDSGIDLVLSLVHVQETDYAETGSIFDALEYMAVPDDGVVDELHDLRSIYGADVVAMLIESTGYCGLGYITVPVLESPQAAAFSVTKRTCATGPNWSFTHELGHNMGCHHDRDNADTNGYFDYSFGHRYDGDSGTEWRTIMAYEPGTRIPYFSNPTVWYDGEPTGVPVGDPASADCAQTISHVVPLMAGYRPRVSDIVWVDFAFGAGGDGSIATPFDTLTEGLATVNPGGTLAVVAGTTALTTTFDQDVVIRAYDGDVVIGDP